MEEKVDSREELLRKMNERETVREKLQFLKRIVAERPESIDKKDK